MIRVAAGPRVGYGHLMRARALAQHLGMPVSLSIRGGRDAARTARSLGLHVLRNANALETAALLVVDDPSLIQGRLWIAKARRTGVPSVSIHDFARVHDADLVVCGSINGKGRRGGIALNGPQYYLLDASVARAARTRQVGGSGDINDRPRILIALGGGRHVRAIAQQLVDAIRRGVADVRIDVAAGFVRGPRPALRGARWLSARQGLASVLAHCDVAVVAGGVTLYEACALGAPTVAVAIVPAQRGAVREFAKRRAVVDAGKLSSRTVARVARQVRMLITDDRRRRATAARAQLLVDGLGAARVAAHMRAMLQRGSRHVA